MTKLVWNVFYHNFNTDRIEAYNVFQHHSFQTAVTAHSKKIKDREAFSEAVRREAQYYFWSKCEWEILISPWISRDQHNVRKIDVYEQLRLNWEPFIDYLWRTLKEEAT